jgi:hypothetical protein
VSIFFIICYVYANKTLLARYRSLIPLKGLDNSDLNSSFILSNNMQSTFKGLLINYTPNLEARKQDTKERFSSLVSYTYLAL